MTTQSHSIGDHRLPCPPPLRLSRAPAHRLPKGAIDTHAHVFEDTARFPLSSPRSFDPPLATLTQYVALMDWLGIAATVQVNASCYGLDNSITAWVIEQLGRDRARGVASISPDIGDDALRALASQGFCAARLSTYRKGIAGAEALSELIARIAPMGWHLEINVASADEWIALETRLADSQVPFVIEHLGRVNANQGWDSPGCKAVRRLLTQRPDCMVKLSSWYRLSASDCQNYADMDHLVHAYLSTFPEQVMWGSNWPHPTTVPMVDDVTLLDQVFHWTGNGDALRKITVDNPRRMYRL
jgi:2-pyrone-4,6-dicarboxylate lactonase